jgi:hypothetical protein
LVWLQSICSCHARVSWHDDASLKWANLLAAPLSRDASFVQVFSLLGEVFHGLSEGFTQLLRIFNGMIASRQSFRRAERWRGFRSLGGNRGSDIISLGFHILAKDFLEEN